MLTDFFKEELKQFDTPELSELGHRIIQAVMDDASVQEFYDLIPVM
jgi:hypothetical protein